VGRKALKRKLGKKVLAGKLTVDEARARLGRKVTQAAYKGAWSSWPAQAPAYQPRPLDEDYIRTAFAPLPRPPAVTQGRKQAAAAPRLAKSYADAKAALLADARASAGVLVPRQDVRPMVVKQLSGVERAMVAELQRELSLTGYDPVQREAISAQIARITGPVLP
jgi:hypothetical protein